ncbi:F0F1 ATP synthase subunit delta [Ningiella sp. W23]|uniref:F0F1 ATP synthase subunit delta n=1 Tax=Ningiella sp. W23 TaxID=3023715 RepID=UPI003756BF63
MSELTTIARPYAKAAFDFAVEQADIENWQSMLVFSAAVTENEDMQSFLSGSVAADKVSEIFTGICGDQLNTHGQNFIKVLAENNRLTVLPDISRVFNELKVEHEKRVDVDVTSASELSDAQIEKLSAALEKRFDRKVQLNCNVDPALVAGLLIKAGDTVIDGSVNSKLNRLKDALQA